MFDLVSIFIASLLFVFINITFAKKFGFIDNPNSRSSHTRPIPRAGGIGFIMAFIMAFILFKYDFIYKNIYLFIGIFIVFILGILDDKYEVSAKIKIFIIILASLLLWFNNIKINTLGEWFSINIELHYFSLPFTIFAIVGFTNALNLIDGIDGLSTSISLIILITFYCIGYHYKDIEIMTISQYLTISLLGFLIFNWNPAKIFMGDSGSLTLGFIIAILAILSIKYIHPITILYITALPILDTLVVMTRRIRSGVSPFKPDKTHLHHIMLAFFNGNVKKTVFFLSILQILFSIVGFLLISVIHNKGSFVAFLALVIFIIMFILFYMIFTGIYKRQRYINLLKIRNIKNRR